MREYKLLINGKWEESKSSKEIKSPYDQSVVGKVYFADKDKMEKAVTAAHEAFAETKKLSSQERAQVLEKIPSGIEKRKEELAKSIALCGGKTINASRIEVERAVNTFKVAQI